MRAMRGFTMIELVVVIMVIGMGLLGITGLFGTAVKGLNTTQDLMAAGQFAQACAEEVLTQHHKTNLVGVPNASLPALCTSTSTVLNRTLTIGNAYINDASKTYCPANVSCRDVLVQVSSKLTPGIQSTINLLLASY